MFVDFKKKNYKTAYIFLIFISLIIFIKKFDSIVYRSESIISNYFPNFLNEFKIDQNLLVLIGHRGGSSNKFKENSLDNIYNTINLGFDFVEVDVQLSSDYEIILSHSKKITLNDKDYYFSDYKLDELNKIIDKEFKLETIDELLELNNITIIIDTLHTDEKSFKKLINKLSKYKNQNFIIQTPSIIKSQLIKNTFNKVIINIFDIEKLKSLNCDNYDYINFNPSYILKEPVEIWKKCKSSKYILTVVRNNIFEVSRLYNNFGLNRFILSNLQNHIKQ